AFDAARDEEAEFRVVHAQAEGALAALERRFAATNEALEHARMRLAALDREEVDHREAIVQLDDLRAAAAAELERLFAARDELEAELRGLDQQAEQAMAAAEELEARTKSTRLNSSHVKISYAVCCLKKKTGKISPRT